MYLQSKQTSLETVSHLRDHKGKIVCFANKFISHNFIDKPKNLALQSPMLALICGKKLLFTK